MFSASLESSIHLVLPLFKMSKRKSSSIDMNTTTERVTFDVGGQKYKISRSQFDKYPDSMIAKTVSDRWLEDPSQEIFIDRDGSVFRHVLSFIRDGKVFLPSSVSKEELMMELEYYGIDCDDDISEYIHEKPSVSINIDIDGYIQHLRNEQENNLAKNSYIDIVIYCMKAYYGGRFGSLGLQKPTDWKYESKVATWKLMKSNVDFKGIAEPYNATRLQQNRLDEMNKILTDVSLKLTTMIYNKGIDGFIFKMTEIVD